MRISINTGFDSIVSSHSNNDNFVLSSSSNIPGSLVEFENRNVADNSATPIIMSELAHVDFDVNPKPSMIETHTDSTVSGFWTTLKGLFKSKSSTIVDSLLDFGGSHTVYAFGKFSENQDLLKELSLINDEFDPDLQRAVKIFFEAYKEFEECYSSYPDEVKNTFETGDEYKKFTKAMKDMPKCLIDVDKIQLTDIEVSSLWNDLRSRATREIDYCKDNCDFKLNECKFYNDFQSIFMSRLRRGYKAKSQLLTGKASKEDIDDILAMQVLGMYDFLMNVAVCDVYKKCPQEINTTYDNKYRPTEVYVQDPKDIRARLIHDVIANNDKCAYFSWKLEDRRGFEQIDQKLADLAREQSQIIAFGTESVSDKELDRFDDLTKEIMILKAKQDKLAKKMRA